MYLSENLTGVLRAGLKQYTNTTEDFQVIKSVSGGSINNCYQIKYGKSFFFLKVNSASDFAQMFIAEAEGLKRIALTDTIKVPQVIDLGVTVNEQFLILEWINTGINNSFSQQDLGRALAGLHKNTASCFGLDHNNYIGSLPQFNKSHSSWSEFFINERLQPQVKLAKVSGLLDEYMLETFEIFYKKLDTLYPVERPALVHGDLWNGNYMINNFQEPVLIDPAITYANREADIAMTMLFGGFHKSFYEAYNEEFPLQKDWQERSDLWNLYPLLVHLNLFGLSYLGQIKQILLRFC